MGGGEYVEPEDFYICRFGVYFSERSAACRSAAGREEGADSGGSQEDRCRGRSGGREEQVERGNRYRRRWWAPDLLAAHGRNADRERRCRHQESANGYGLQAPD